MIMKTILLAGTTLFAAAAMPGAAHATDMGNYDWSGFSIGINAGGAMNNSDVKRDLEVTGANAWLSSGKSTSSGDDNAFTAGGSLGYDWQVDSIVFGLETDVNYGGFKGQESTDYTGAYNDPSKTASSLFSHESDWYGTLRGRLGYATGNFLAYGTAGLAYGGISTDASYQVKNGNTSLGGWDGSSDTLALGWTAGAGLEYGFDRWSLGLEYLYVDLGSVEWSHDVAGLTGSSAGLNGTSGSDSVDYRFNVVRATAKIRF